MEDIHENKLRKQIDVIYMYVCMYACLAGFSKSRRTTVILFQENSFKPWNQLFSS